MLKHRTRNHVSIVINGEPASKANQRKLVKGKGGRPMFIKSAKALAYVKAVEEQVPPLEELWEEDVVFNARIYYASRRPDLDESLILDALQGRVYKNDRQVKEKHVWWFLDREHPRAEIEILREGSRR